jgi:hypothetical protein
MTASVCLKMGYANTRRLAYGGVDKMMVRKININTIHYSLCNKIPFLDSDTLHIIIDKYHWIVTSP